MTKYLTEERFIVQSNDKESLRNYREGWERTFGEKEPEPAIVDGCPQHGAFCDGHVAVTPEQQAVRDYLAAGGEPSPIGWYGVISDDEDEDPGAPPAKTYFVPRHLDNTEAECRNGARSLTLDVLYDHDACSTCNAFADDPSALIEA